MKKLRPEDLHPEWYAQKYNVRPVPPNQEILQMLERVGMPFRDARGNRFLNYFFGDGCSLAVSLLNPAVRLAAIHEYTQKHGHPPRENPLRSAFRAFQARARNLCLLVGLRIAQDNQAIHIDPAWFSGRQAGRHIEVNAYGWVTRRNSVQTILPPTVAPLPEVSPMDAPADPLAALEPLRELLRLQNDRPAWFRVLLWLLAAFRPAGSPDTPRDYPILRISGPAGSGKTSAARMLRSLIDPSTAPINFTPSSESAASRLTQDNTVVFIDGVTRLARKPAELLARLSTGIPAKFHGDMQNTSRPILLTTNDPTAADRLTARTLAIELPALASPIPQDDLRQRFESLRPSLVAALLSLLSTALRRLPGSPIPENTRFPEAVQWAAAALETIDANELISVTRPDAPAPAPADPLQTALAALLEQNKGQWKGTATELTEALNVPLTPRALSQKLKKISHICVISTRSKTTRTLTLNRRLPASRNVDYQAAA